MSKMTITRNDNWQSNKNDNNQSKLQFRHEGVLIKWTIKLKTQTLY